MFVERLHAAICHLVAHPTGYSMFILAVLFLKETAATKSLRPYGRWLSARQRHCVQMKEECGIKTVRQAVRYEEVIKKSRFVALAAPVSSAEAAITFVRELSDKKAQHNCYAWRLGNGDTRTNGDGEPGGTAGPPILAAIEGAGWPCSSCCVTIMNGRLTHACMLALQVSTMWLSW